MKENRIGFEFTARYYDNGLSLEDSIELLFVFHGQGQLAQFFIRKFEVLRNRGIRVIAPEGLSRYYLEGNYGRVGASWMTREDRLQDIDNYLKFINSIYRHEVMDPDYQGKISTLGFSQGAATVSRWISQPHIRFDQLILWAGMFPPDLDWKVSRSQLMNKKVSFVYGTSDPYLSDERFKEQQEISDQLGVTPQQLTFDGGHTIDEKVLLELF